MRANIRRGYGWWLVLLLSVVGVSANSTDLRLVEAVKEQDHEAVRALLKQRVDVNVPQPDGATALHWATYGDALDMAGLLIDAGADVNVANDYGVTPLSLACDNGAAAMVEVLLTAGADPNAARSTGETPLMTCARTGDVDAVNLLATHGANPNLKESWQEQTPLMWAVGERHTEVARALIEHGADVHARSKGGFTALLIAARDGDPDLVQLLLDAGADVNDTTPDGTTPLLVATVRGQTAQATFLLDRGANPNADGTGYTPLHWAAGSWHTELTGPSGIVTDRDDEWRSLNGLGTGKLELVKALLAHGANPDVRLVKGPPQFGYASGRFRIRLAGATPFLLAAMDGNVGVMRALAAAGADPLLGTEQNTTPLMAAAGVGRVPAESHVTASGTLEAVQFALDLGGDVTRANDAGDTPLHGAAHIRSDALVQLLVDQGARVHLENVRGLTPLMVAEGAGHSDNPGLGSNSAGDLLRTLGSPRSSR